jgi:3-ketosteroid 9alpha-monooxygenase subunit A
MKVPFTWRPTGWFMVGWGIEISAGTVKPLKYLGNEQVAYRTRGGELHVLDAHCPCCGAHLGHGGRIDGDGVICPRCAARYGPDGVNVTDGAFSVGVWPVLEQHECVFIWNDPAGGPPRWEMPNLFTVI